MNKKLQNWARQKYFLMRRKYLVSQFWFIFLNLMSFMISASIIVLNLYAIKWNNNSEIKNLFVIMAIISAIIVFFTTIVTFFTFKKSAVKARHKLERIKDEYAKFAAQDEEYQGVSGEHLIVKRITYIFNED